MAIAHADRTYRFNAPRGELGTVLTRIALASGTPIVAPAMSDLTVLPFAFPSVRSKRLTAESDGGCLTSDGGAPLLAQAARRLDIALKLTAVIRDRQDWSRIAHPVPEILLARRGIVSRVISPPSGPWSQARPA